MSGLAGFSNGGVNESGGVAAMGSNAETVITSEVLFRQPLCHASGSVHGAS